MVLHIEPCIKVDGEFVDDSLVSESFAKIDEELNELKGEILSDAGGLNQLIDTLYTHTDTIALEAIDTITAIISMLNAIGIDQEDIDAACQTVISKNRERGRLDA